MAQKSSNPRLPISPPPSHVSSNPAVAIRLPRRQNSLPSGSDSLRVEDSTMGLSHHEIESCDGVVTAAFAGVADCGTIVLHHSPREGRRVLTLLPDFHLCILRSTQIVETLPEYFARCPQPPRLATYVSGPSATADIEMTRIKGVHGPRFLSVILVHDDL